MTQVSLLPCLSMECPCYLGTHRVINKISEGGVPHLLSIQCCNLFYIPTIVEGASRLFGVCPITSMPFELTSIGCNEISQYRKCPNNKCIRAMCPNCINDKKKLKHTCMLSDDPKIASFMRRFNHDKDSSVMKTYDVGKSIKCGTYVLCVDCKLKTMVDCRDGTKLASCLTFVNSKSDETNHLKPFSRCIDTKFIDPILFANVFSRCGACQQLIVIDHTSFNFRHSNEKVDRINTPQIICTVCEGEKQKEEYENDVKGNVYDHDHEHDADKMNYWRSDVITYFRDLLKCHSADHPYIKKRKRYSGSIDTVHIDPCCYRLCPVCPRSKPYFMPHSPAIGDIYKCDLPHTVKIVGGVSIEEQSPEGQYQCIRCISVVRSLKQQPCLSIQNEKNFCSNIEFEEGTDQPLIPLKTQNRRLPINIELYNCSRCDLKTKTKKWYCYGCLYVHNFKIHWRARSKVLKTYIEGNESSI
jgi:hypothetical protein